MHRLTPRRLRVCRGLPLALALCCVGCESKDAAPRDADPSADEGGVGAEDGGASSLDAAADAQVPDAQPVQDASGDAAASDASGGAEGGAAEAGTDAGPRTLRAQVCGDGGSWPAPLPAQMNQRRAQPVGTQSFGFLEGPVWIAEQGVLLFSDMDTSGDDAQGPPARIRRLRPPATYDVFAEASNSNGLALTNDGVLLAASHDIQSLSLFQLASGARTPLTVRSDGKRFNSPNDLTVRSDGTVYFTDPMYQIGDRDSETMIMGVYRVRTPAVTSDVNAATLVDGTLFRPNGIALSPDERTLYVGSYESEIWRYEVAADGSTGRRTKFADTGSSDGMTIDCAGNLYVTSGTVEVFGPGGEILGEITLGDDPTNVAFGGADRKTLYITAGSSLYSIRLNVPGFPY